MVTSSAPSSAAATANPDYDTEGYDYTVVIKGAGGQVQVFDAPFCEVGSNGTGGASPPSSSTSKAATGV